jgi:outer membrane protein assembly factor BamB
MRLKAITGILFTVFLLGALILTSSVQPVAANAVVDWWSMFHHDLSHTGYSTSTAPNTNHTIWIYTAGDFAGSSPAVADGKVYIGTYPDKVYCLDALTGVHIWNYTTGGAVYSSPAVVDGKVYIGSYDGKVYCLDAFTGAHIWNYTTGDSISYSSPAVADGKVYVGSEDGKVYCLDALTGAHIWNYTTGSAIAYSSLAVAYGKVYVGSYVGKVYCLDALTGAHVWNYTTDWYVWSSPAVVDGKVYIGILNGKVYCLDAFIGAHIWNYTTGSHVFSSPAVAYDKVYVGAFNGKVYCLDAGSGAHIWSYTTDDEVFSSPAVADGKVYIGSNDGKVYAFGTSVLSVDSVGSPKATFDLTDNVYVRGEGFTADSSVTIYLLPDGADASPSNAVANASATTTSTGDLPVTLVWSQPLTLGEYDIWVDVYPNGVFDGADVWNSQAIGIYTFDVIPEFLTLTSMLLILALATVSLATYKRKLLKKPIH